MKPSFMKVLTECGIEVNHTDFLLLSEEAKVKVTDETMTGLLKFITDKYNSMDFEEIEKSAGNIRKFKYTSILKENNRTLYNIYESSSDPGAKKYLEVCSAVNDVIVHLEAYSTEYSDLYKAGNGVIQLLYTSLVAGCIYAVGTLVSNTIRFVTVEQETDCQVLFDEIPGTIKHVHIKNILAAARDIGTYTDLVKMYTKERKNGRVNEDVTFASCAAVVLGGFFLITLIPRVITLIREIIYSVYYNRVKVADMLQMQIDLINTNIESLESGRGQKKVIARQKAIVKTLQKWQKIIAVKMDTTNTLVATQKRKENATLKVDRNSPLVQEPGYSSGDIML